MLTLNKLIITIDNNVQSLTVKIYKYLHDLSATVLDEVFKVNETIPYDFRMRNELYGRNTKTAKYGTENIFLSSKNLGFDFTKYKRF